MITVTAPARAANHTDVVRFLFLDGLRGLAAVAVMLAHLGAEFNVTALMPHGYLAVDFFFVLSGFVLAHAYEDRLGRVLSFRNFARIRAIRLYPMALLGQLIAVLSYLSLHLHHVGLTFLVVSLLGFVMIPLPFDAHIQYPNMFPLNPPFWTLFCEFYVNLVYARFAKLRTNGLLLVTIVTFAVALAVLAFQKNTVNVAEVPAALAYAAARTGFSFFIGVWLYRLWVSRKVPAVRGTILLCALVVSFAIPDLRSIGHSLSVGADLLIIFGLIPFIVVTGASTPVTDTFKHLAEMSGRMSYPLYAIHFPIILFTKAVAAKMGFEGVQLFAFVAGAMLGTIMLAWISVKMWDEPARRWLGRISRTIR